MPRLRPPTKISRPSIRNPVGLVPSITNILPIYATALDQDCRYCIASNKSDWFRDHAMLQLLANRTIWTILESFISIFCWKRTAASLPRLNVSICYYDFLICQFKATGRYPMNYTKIISRSIVFHFRFQFHLDCTDPNLEPAWKKV